MTITGQSWKAEWTDDCTNSAVDCTTINIWHRNVPCSSTRMLWDLNKPDHPRQTLEINNNTNVEAYSVDELLPLSHSFLYNKVTFWSWTESMRTSVCSTERSVLLWEDEHRHGSSGQHTAALTVTTGLKCWGLLQTETQIEIQSQKQFTV